MSTSGDSLVETEDLEVACSVHDHHIFVHSFYLVLGFSSLLCNKWAILYKLNLGPSLLICYYGKRTVLINLLLWKKKRIIEIWESKISSWPYNFILFILPPRPKIGEFWREKLIKIEIGLSYNWCNSTRVTHFLSYRFFKDQTIKKEDIFIYYIIKYLPN